MMMNSVDGGGGGGSHGGGYPPMRQDTLDSMSSSMPPPMRELNTSGYPPGILTPRGEEPPPPHSAGGRYGGGGPGSGGAGSGAEDFFSPSNEYYGSDTGGEGPPGPGRGQRLLHRMASDSARYGRGRFQHQHSGGSSSMQSPTAAMANGTSGGGGSRRSYTLQYSSRHHGGHHHQQQPSSYSRGMSSSSSHHHHQGGGRSRHYSGLDYASDTEALHSPAASVSSMRLSRAMRAAAAGGTATTGGGGFSARSSSLPRTFQREALLRHPELSMEMDRLAQATDPAALLSGLSTDDQLSDSGAVSAPESVITARKRGAVFCVRVSPFIQLIFVPPFSSRLPLSVFLFPRS